ncbi:MAG: hypothetical protein AAFV77_07805, partial [Planctomycetota bacterium]
MTDCQDAGPEQQHTRAIATGGNPASLVVYGEAQAIATLDDGTVLAASGRVGKGRVVAIGHGGFLNDERGDTRAFIDDQIRWLAQDGVLSAWGVSEARLARLGEHGLVLRLVEGDA